MSSSGKHEPCAQTNILNDIRESQIRMEEQVKMIDIRLTSLENTRATIGWWIIGGVGAAVAGLFTLGLKH